MLQSDVTPPTASDFTAQGTLLLVILHLMLRVMFRLRETQLYSDATSQGNTFATNMSVIHQEHLIMSILIMITLMFHLIMMILR